MRNSYRDGDVAFFMSLLNIAMRFDDLVERVDPVNDRFEFVRLDHFFERQHVFDLLTAV